MPEFRTPIRAALAGLVAAALLVAVAHGQAPSKNSGFTTLFISPCGEPYRGAPGEPYPVIFWFDQTDTNHDGAIDLAEFRADCQGFFQMLDLDRNGYLDGTEVGVYERTMIPDALHGERVGALTNMLILIQFSGPTGRPNETTRRQTPILEGAAPFGLLGDSEPVASADGDLNGRITLAEFISAADRRFKRLDVNGDGKLTMAELPRTPADIAGTGRPKRR